jgi:hypothetical protein
MLRKSLRSNRVFSFILPIRKPLPRGLNGNETDAEFFEGRQHFRFRASRPQRVFALHGRDRLSRVCATNRFRPCFRKAEVLDLAFLNQVLHRSRDVFDRHVRIHTVLVEQIDRIDLEPLEGGLGNLLDVFGPTVQTDLLPVGTEFEPASTSARFMMSTARAPA